jgi:predicted negative regulator of RcsB-dependent stress response
VNQVTSDIALGNYSQASKHIADAAGSIHEKLDAMVEYISALKRSKMYDEALKYIDSINLDSVSKFVRCNLAAHRAEILLKRKQYSQAFLLASKICDELLAKFSSKEYGEACAQALFAKGSAAYKLKDARSGREAFEFLRTHFPHTAYSALSFLRESNFFRASGDMAQAIATLKLCKVAEYIPHANYEIALLKLRSTGDFREAIRLMGEIIREYPDADVAMAARVAQGDILRSIGDFDNAQLVYENAQKFPNSPRNANYLSLAVAKCLIAKKNRDSRCLDSAIDILQSLCSTSRDADFRLECVAEYCLALVLKNKYGALEKFAIEFLSALDSSEFKFSGKSRYWMAQISFILRGSFRYFQKDSAVRIGTLLSKYEGMCDD